MKSTYFLEIEYQQASIYESYEELVKQQIYNEEFLLSRTRESLEILTGKAYDDIIYLQVSEFIFDDAISLYKSSYIGIESYHRFIIYEDISHRESIILCYPALKCLFGTAPENLYIKSIIK